VDSAKTLSAPPLRPAHSAHVDQVHCTPLVRGFQLAFGINCAYCNNMLFGRITIDPEVCGGRPCVRGMRVTVSQILEMLAGGMTSAQILQDFPYLESADIDACLQYAAQQAAHREIVLAK